MSTIVAQNGRTQSGQLASLGVLINQARAPLARLRDEAIAARQLYADAHDRWASQEAHWLRLIEALEALTPAPAPAHGPRPSIVLALDALPGPGQPDPESGEHDHDPCPRLRAWARRLAKEAA